MNRHLLFCYLLCSITASAQPYQPDQREQIIFDRMAYVFRLKDVINDDIWKGFTAKQYDVPLIYYTDTSSYVANPTAKFLKVFSTVPVFRNGEITVYKTSKRVDSIPFHMSTGYEAGDDAIKAYNYLSPFMGCSGFEETQHQIPDVASVEEWATMVIHEYFHGFQYKHPALFRYSNQNFLYIKSDSLKRIYRHNAWYKEGIDKENDLLLEALQSTSDSLTQQLIAAFFQLREMRRKETVEQLHFEVSKYEQYYETVEGTARYTEYGLYQQFATLQPDAVLQKEDTSFRSYKRFKNYDLSKDKWLYLTSQTSYVYAMGFNMARLLDKLGVAYQPKLFDTGFSLEAVLRKQVKK